MILAVISSQLIPGSLATFASENNNMPVSSKNELEENKMAEAVSELAVPRSIEPRSLKPTDKILVTSAIRSNDKTWAVTYTGITSPRVYVEHEVQVDYWEEYHNDNPQKQLSGYDGTFQYTTKPDFKNTGCLINNTSGMVTNGSYILESRTCVTIQGPGQASYPAITAPNITLNVGDSFSPMQGVTANDKNDGNITAKVVVTSNNVNTNSVGTYTVTYSVKNNAGFTAVATRTVTVQKKVTIPKITAPDITLYVGDTFSPMQGVKAMDEQDGDITAKVKITSNTVDTNEVGTYKVTYSVINSSGKSTSVTRTVTVKNRAAAPTITTDPIYDVTTEIKGKANGVTVYAYIDSSTTPIGQATVDSDGSFTMTISPQKANQTIKFVSKFANGDSSAEYTTIIQKATIEISRAKKTGIIGTTEQLSVTTNPPGLAVTWSSSNSKVATVSSNGLVTYVSEGTVVITAKIISGTTATITITVEKGKPQPPKVPSAIHDVTGLATGTAGANEKVIATVDGKEIGSTTADKDGQFTINFPEQPAGTVIAFVAEAANGAQSDATEKTVVAATIKINEAATSSFVGKSINLTTTTTPKDAKVTWSSSDDKRATVSAAGAVTLKGAGKVTITAKLANGQSATVTITIMAIPKVSTPLYDVTTEVSGTASEGAVVAYVDGEEIGRALAGSDGTFTMTIPEQAAGTTVSFVAENENGASSDAQDIEVQASSIVINETGKTGFVKDTLQLTATTTPVGQAVTWSTSNAKVATVDAKTGLVTFNAVGVVSVKASLKNGKVAQTSITVTNKVIEPPKVTTPIYEDSTQASGTAPTPGKVVAKDKDGNVLGEATVDEDGNFTVTFDKQPAGSTIEFIAKDEKANESKPVEAEVLATTITINETLTSGFVGKKANLTTTTTPKDAKVTWTSSDSKIATVSATGVVTFEAEGTVTITAKLASGKADTVTVIVKDAPKVNTPIYDVTTSVSGTAPTPGTVTAYVAGNPIGIATVGTDGTFTVTIPVQKTGTVISFTAKDADNKESNPTDVTVKASTVIINEAIKTGYIQDTAQLTTTTTPAGQAVTWSTSDASVATVSSTGLVTYKAAGDVTITATLKNGQKASVTIAVTKQLLTVNAPVITTAPIYDVTTTIEGTAKEAGDSKAITVTAYVLGLQVGIADVQADGTFTMKLPEQVAGSMISFVAEDKRENLSAPKNVIVVSSSVKIQEKPTSGFVKETQQLTATTTPAGQQVTWTTSDAKVATVSETGLVTYLSVGSVVIKASLPNESYAQVTIDVTKKVIDSPVVTTPIYDNTTKASGTAPTPGKVVAKDKDGKVLGEATVGTDGKFTLSFDKQPAESTIAFIAQDEKANESTPTNVEVIASTVVINEKVTTGKVGDTQALTATTTPKGQTVTWSTSDATIATIDANTGLVTYKKAGSATLTAKLANGKSDTITITVSHVQLAKPTITTNPIYDVSREVVGKATKPATKVVAYLNGLAVGTADIGSDGAFTMEFPGLVANQEVLFIAEDGKGNQSESITIPITAATVSINAVKATLEAFVGDTKQLTVTTTPVGQPVVWASSNESIAKVDANGLVTFVGKGKVTITVTLENSHTATDTIVFDVKDKVYTLTANDYTIGETTITGAYDKEATKVVLYVNGKAEKNSALDPATMTYKVAAKSFITNASQKVEMVMSKGTTELKRVVVNVIDATAKPTIKPVKDTDTSISGTAPANSTITIQVDGKTIGTGTTNASGEYTIAIPAQVAETVLQVTAKEGNKPASEAATTTVISNKTAAPTVNPVENRDTSVSGTAPANSTVTIQVDGKTIGTGTADGKGNYTITIPVQTIGTVVSVTAKEGAKQPSEAVTTTVFGDDVAVKPNEYNVDSDSYVTGTVGKDVHKVRVYVNGKAINNLTVKNGTFKGYLRSYVTSIEDEVRVVSIDAAGDERETVDVNLVYNNVVLTADTFTIGTDEYVKGKIDTRAKSAVLFDTDTNTALRQVAVSGGTYQISAIDLIQTTTTNYAVVAKQGKKEMKRVKVDVKQLATQDYTLTAQEYTLGEATITGVYDKEATKVVLYVDGVVKKNSALDATTMTYAVLAKSFVTSTTQKVEMVMSKGTKELKRIVVNVKEPAANAYTLTAEDYALGDALITGTYDKEATKVVLYVDGVVKKNSALDASKMTYAVAAKSFIKNTTQKVEMVMSKGTKELKRVVVTVKEAPVNNYTLTASDYTMGEAAITGTYDKEATKVVLYVDGVAKKNSVLDPATMTYSVEATGHITDASQKVEMVMSKGATELKRVTVNISKKYTLTADPYTLGEAYVTGTYDKEATKVVLYVDGVAKKNSALDSTNMTYSIAAKGLVTSKTQKVELVMSKGTQELKRVTLVINDAPANNYILTADDYTLGDSTITGTYDKEATRVVLYIDGEVVKNSALNSETMTYSIAAQGLITSISQKVELVMSANGKELKRVQLNVKEAPIKNYTLTADDYTVGDPEITGTYDKEATKVVLYVDGVAQKNSALDETKLTYSVLVGSLVTNASSKVEMVMSKGAEELKRVTVNVTKKYDFTVDAYTIGQSYITGKYDKEATKVVLYIDGVAMKNSALDPATMTYKVVGKGIIKNTTQKVELVMSKGTTELQRITVSVQE
ncbi:DUF5011 domain-containing protein [Listeria weihenstephanensis]|uniref:DUF5011 domain-containing protein n=1 Tax=Listeria weihenstephanensis TaxID=1006155 RepID=A0A841Z985_9LIST|nr:Ig-like domain-containing protein [Listeria weihenstephanensis]MBC1501875.1 DUF5011 domain-containing protein [Listeria weihenstephanensis]